MHNVILFSKTNYHVVEPQDRMYLPKILEPYSPYHSFFEITNLVLENGGIMLVSQLVNNIIIINSVQNKINEFSIWYLRHPP